MITLFCCQCGTGERLQFDSIVLLRIKAFCTLYTEYKAFSNVMAALNTHKSKINFLKFNLLNI
ncbi:hypothetical protein VCSRO22_3463 [Vibrio cholerae]|nr:hypothetical protein VCSRO22_3463 [Vibrio cholerae]